MKLVDNNVLDQTNIEQLKIWNNNKIIHQTHHIQFVFHSNLNLYQ